MQLKVKIILFSILLSLAASAQQKNNLTYITVQFSKITLSSALTSITDKYHIPIAYNSQEADKYYISADYKNMSVEKVLKQLAKTAKMEVAKINDVFVLKPAESKSVKSLVSISAKVEDESSGEPLSYALATIPNSKLFSTTNRQGVFSFLNIVDTAMIQLSYLGYKDTLIAVRDLKSTIKLRPDPSLLKEVVIKDQGSNTIIYGEETSKVTFNPSALDRLPVLGGNDVFRALQLLPGISGTNETSAGLIVRGSSPDKNLVLLDGYSLYHVDHFYGIYSAFNSKAIKSVQLYKGNFLAKYGGRSSSVMVLTAKDGNKTKFSGDIGVNFVDVNGVFEFVLSDKLTLVAAARRSITDVVENYLFKELFDKAVINSGDVNNASNLNYNELSPNFSFGDYNLKMTYRPTKEDNLAVSFYASNDNLSYEYTSDIEKFVEYTTSERSIWGNLGFSTIWSKQWNKKLSTQTQVAYSSYYNNTKLEDSFVYNDTLGLADEEYVQAQNNNVRDFTLKIDNQYRTSKNTIIDFGIANTFNTINLSSIINEEEFPLLEQEGNQFQFYTDYNVFITPKIETKLGLRGNYFNLTDILYWEPKVNLKYHVLPWMTLKGSWAINNQMISRILRLDLFASNPDFWLLSDKNIPVINSNHFAGGVHLNFSVLTLDIEGYISNTYDEVQYLPSLRNFDVEEKNPEQLYASGNSKTRGIEVLVEKGVGNYSGWISYTLSNSLNYFEELNGGKPFPSRYDQRHELKLVNMYNVGDWNFSLIWIYGTGKPYSAPEGSYSLSTIDGSNISNIAYSKINNERLPNYHRLDLSSTYNFKLGNTKAKVGLSIFNVYNRKNIKYRRFSKINFDEDGNLLANDKYIISDILLLGVTPSVFLNWKF
ncbi:MAG: TonB-dependent receptor [Cyclobacteriaceae bacterium]|nr:TonB-dependent receptor [Cyclobacteriaceae bacterium]